MWAALFASLNNGLGKDSKLLSAADTSQVNQSFFTSRIFLFLALTFSKCSVPIFMRNIFSYLKHVVLITNATIAVITLWGLASVLAVSIACSPNDVVTEKNDAHCVNDVLRLKAITIVDVITEAVILLLPIMPLSKIHMSTYRKFLVMFAFSFRIPNIIITLMYLKAYSNFVHFGRSGTALASPVVWQNVLLSYNLMSATIPALKGFMKGFTTGGMGYTGDLTTQGDSSGSTTNSYKMLSLSKMKTKAGLLPQDYPASAARVTSVPNLPVTGNAKGLRRATKSGAENQENESIASIGSRKILIRKDWEISTME